jgi:hypothetical protein
MTLLSPDIPLGAAHPAVRRVDQSDLRWALSEGWKDFREKRGDVIFLALIYPVVGLIAGVAVFNSRMLPLFFPLVAGLSIFGPAVAAGFYEIARRREQGLDSTWVHFFDPMRGRSRAALVQLTAGLVVLFAGWVLAAWAIYAATIGASEPAGMADFFHRLFATPQGWTLIVLGNLVGFAFAVVTLVLAVVSFPLVVDKPVDAGRHGGHDLGPGRDAEPGGDGVLGPQGRGPFGAGFFARLRRPGHRPAGAGLRDLAPLYAAGRTLRQRSSPVPIAWGEGSKGWRTRRGS